MLIAPSWRTLPSNGDIIKENQQHWQKIISINYYRMAHTSCISNFQNGSGFSLYGNTRLSYDKCSKTSSENQSQGPGDYSVSNHYACSCRAPQTSQIAYNQPVVNFRDGYGVSGMKGCTIDQDSLMRNGQLLTNLRCKNQLFSRPYLTVPYMGRGTGDPCYEGNILAGEDTSQARACNTLSEVTINNSFYPLVPCLQENIQNPIHLIPEVAQHGWIRGGIPSRQWVKNVDYQVKCGHYYS